MTEINRIAALIESAVASYYGADVALIRLNTRSEYTVKLRQMCIYLCHLHGYTEAIIAEEYGKNRSTIYSCISKLSTKASKSAKFRSELEAIKSLIDKSASIELSLIEWFEERHNIKHQSINDAQSVYGFGFCVTFKDRIDEIRDFLKHIGLITK